MDYCGLYGPPSVQFIKMSNNLSFFHIFLGMYKEEKCSWWSRSENGILRFEVLWSKVENQISQMFSPL